LITPPRYAVSRPAFTLIELLVVISIISILIALLLPALSTARESARRITCAANLKALGTVSYLYEQDYKQLPPGSNHSARNYIADPACDAVRDHYGFSIKSTICPGAGPYKGTSGRWDSPAAGLGGRMTYFYLGGWGGLDPDPSNFKFGSIDSGWASSPFRSASQGHGPLVTTLKMGHRLMPTLSNHFLAADLAMYGPTVASYIPLNPNHGTLRDPSDPDGANSLFGDGHVAWHRLSSGVGWVYWSNTGSSANVIAWNPPYIPAGATLMP
jgi:prepilin-type N-terminal cleavage/methylation domain-containing protein/prepilin-type processing-associated H-X9-DG protein